MNDQTDSQLLCAYAEHCSEPAFAELVRRHVDFVYSAALRMVCDSCLAQDVTQAVFVALAKNAPQLMDRPVLSGWLHRTAQNIAAQTVRTDVRRRAREHEAAAMNEMLSAEPDALWGHIAPHLDAALCELSEADRDVLLLRYFERKSAREMAQTLGTSEDAAQKRVSRAVERLREFFAKRGVTVGASGLVVISANAVQAAPVGLAVTISTAAALAGTAFHTSIAVSTTKAIAMTALQKTLVTSVIAATITTAIYQTRQAAIWRDRSQALHEQTGAQIQQLTGERDAAMRQLAALGAETNRAGNTAELLRLRGEMARLRALESDVAKLREESTRNQAEARKAGADLAASEEVAHQFLVRRITSIDAMKQVGHQLRQLAAANNLTAAFTADGKLNPNLIAGTHPNFDMKDVELSLSDPSQLPKLLQEAPETIVARTVDPVATPDERWMRFYIQADGSVQNYSTPFSNQVFSGNWQLELLKP